MLTLHNIKIPHSHSMCLKTGPRLAVDRSHVPKSCTDTFWWLFSSSQ